MKGLVDDTGVERPGMKRGFINCPVLAVHLGEITGLPVIELDATAAISARRCRSAWSRALTCRGGQ
jgi:hypothetical protein